MAGEDSSDTDPEMPLLIPVLPILPSSSGASVLQSPSETPDLSCSLRPPVTGDWVVFKHHKKIMDRCQIESRFKILEGEVGTVIKADDDSRFILQSVRGERSKRLCRKDFVYKDIPDAWVVELLLRAAETEDLADILCIDWHFFKLGAPLGDAGIKVLARNLKVCSKLFQINLGCNLIGDAGAEALALNLKDCSKLEKLLLGGNPIGDAGAIAIAVNLMACKALSHIDLSSCQIGDAGAEDLAVSLDSVDHLDLRANNISGTRATLLKRNFAHIWGLDEQRKALQLVLLWTVVSATPTEVHISSWEPSDLEYWGRGAQSTDDERAKNSNAAGVHTSALPVPSFRASKLSRITFDNFVREGRPFVVRGVGDSHPMRGWNCSYFHQDEVFRDVKVRQEYTSSSTSWPAWLRLGDLQSRNNAETKIGINSAAGSTSPYYFGIKDSLDQTVEDLEADPFADSTWSKVVLEKVQKHTIVPKFMDPGNAMYLNRTPEFWFSPESAAGGAKAHVDQHTESTMSLQLSGRKRWQLGFIAPRAAPHIMKMYQDGQIYEREEKNHWNAFSDVYLDPGDAIFFGPGFIHQTNADNTCTASVTWQFNIPLPTILWQRFLPRIRWTPDLLHIWDILRDFVFQKKPDRIFSDAEISFLDIDGDGKVTTEEHANMRKLWEKLEQQIISEVPESLRARRFGVLRIIEDAEDLKRYPAKLQHAIKQWEHDAFQRDKKAHMGLQVNQGIHHSEL